MPSWPTAGGFPQLPLALSWTRQSQDIVTEFKPAVGPARLRRLVTGAQQLCSGSFSLTSAQRQILEDFWRIDCRLGVLTFTWRDPEDQTLVRTWEWAERPSIPHRTGGLYVATVSLIRL